MARALPESNMQAVAPERRAGAWSALGRDGVRTLLDRPRFRAAFAVAAGILYLALAVATAVTQRPRADEGFFASPALNLLRNGTMGTTVLEGSHEFMKDIHRYTYWITPLDFPVQAAWYAVFGFSLLAMRALSMVWGLVAAAAWFMIVKTISRDSRVALVTAAIVALDFHFILGASSGRMDMMSAALGFSALAAYLTLRERRFTAAVVAGNALVCASGLTHPVGGYLYFFGLAILTLYFDRRRLRLRHLLWVAIPYVAGGGAWGLYILQDPEAFRAQFSTNATMGNRLDAITAPWIGVWREITARYLASFGVGSRSLSGGPIQLKLIGLIVYVVGFAGALWTREVRGNKGYRALALLTGVFFLLLSVFDNQKAYYYLIHTLPFFGACLAAWLWWARVHGRAHVWIAAAAVALLLAVQIGGIAVRARGNAYARSYRPAVEFLAARAAPGDLIMGSASLAFGLGFPDNFVDDVRLGYYTGKKPAYIVVNEEYAWVFRNYSRSQPEVHAFITKRLDEEFGEIYNSGGYRVYAAKK